MALVLPLLANNFSRIIYKNPHYKIVVAQHGTYHTLNLQAIKMCQALDIGVVFSFVKDAFFISEKNYLAHAVADGTHHSASLKSGMQ